MGPAGPVNPAAYHVFPETDFDEIARGGGGPEAIARLLASEYSRRLLLVKVLLDLASAHPELLGPLPPATAAWRELERLQALPQSAAVLRDVLMHPQLGVWLSHAIRAVKNRVRPTPMWLEVGQIHCATFAAAVRSGQAAQTLLPVREGGVILPTLGLARFAGLNGPAVATAVTTHGVTSLRVGRQELILPHDLTQDSDCWWSLRRLDVSAVGRTLSVYLDDVDPFRDLADPVPPQRLSDTAVTGWRELLDGAWHILNSCAGETAAAMSVGLRSLAPLPESRDGSTRSASTGDGFGAALLTRPPTAVSLAETLVHEFQHSKLGGLLHLGDFVEGDDESRHYAPWRDDPRPLGGLLQGVYAFLGITAFWRSRLECGKDPADQFDYAFARRQTWIGLYALMKSRRLTELGERFVNGMNARLQPWMAERVSRTALHGSWYATTDHRIGWRVRNLRPDPDVVREMADSWMGANRAVPDDRPWAFSAIPWSHRRVTLYRIHASAPERFLALQAKSARDADLDLVGGEVTEALTAYRARLRDNADDGDAWAGLALACIAGGRHLPWRCLLRRPELASGVYRRLRRLRVKCDPLAIAQWCEQHGATAASGRRRSRP